MENTARLNKLITDIELIYLEATSSSKQPLKKKLEQYNQGMILLREAKPLVDALQNEITNLDLSKADLSQMDQASRLIKLMSVPNLKFQEILPIVKQLKEISTGVPQHAIVNDHIEKEAILYEEDADL